MLINISFLGECFLVAVFLLCGFAAVLGLVALKLETGKPASYRQIETARKVFFWAKTAMLIAVGLSVVVLLLALAAFLMDDFSIAVVARYSSVEQPFFYKISALWASSAGSLLLWSVVVFVLFALWLVSSEIDDLAFNAIALSVGAGVCLGFSALCVFVAKPFASCPVTTDVGAGLNPLLRSFWMTTHPPLLFLGYSAFTIPFVIVSASVFAGRADDSDVYRQLRRWLLAGFCFLGLGIVTGARWSYVELGWGGYWAWDPVENASLLPCLVAVAALHSLAGTQLADRFKRWTVTLAPVPFILCLVATFITRSGILRSVHAFSQNLMFWALLAFITCCFLLWIACIIRAAKDIPIIRSLRISIFRLEKSNVLFWANVVLISTAVVIGTATFWPVICRVFTSSDSGVTVTRAFYDNVISVVGILLAFLIGLGVMADLRKRSSFALQLLICCVVGLACFGLVFKLAQIQLLLSLACGICAFSFVAVLMKLWLNLKTSGKIGANVAYLGLLLLVVAAGFSSAERVITTRLTKAGKITLGGYELIYDSFEQKSVAGVTKTGPEIIVRKKGMKKRLWPHNNLYPSGQSTAEVDIHTGIFEDVYVSFDGVDHDGRVVITAKLKPLMLWLWVAALLIVAGPALALLEGKKEEDER